MDSHDAFCAATQTCLPSYFDGGAALLLLAILVIIGVCIAIFK